MFKAVFHLADRSKFVISAYSEGDIKWNALNRNQFVLNGTISGMNLSDGLFSSDCSFMPIIVFLEDHKADTLKRVVAAAEDFIANNDTGDAVFKLAAGNAGIEAATNEVVERAQTEMLIWVYSVVAILVWLAFRSVRTVICIIAPLALTSLAVFCTDGGAGYRCESGHSASDRLGRGYWCGLRHLHLWQA